MTYFQTGDIYLANLEPVQGSEQGRTRPVVVFQNPDLGRFTRTAICVPLTTNMARLGLPGTCLIRRSESRLSQDSIALCFQLRALDGARLAKRLGRLGRPATESLADAILNALGISVDPV